MFTERTERLVSGIAAQAAIAIDNARLYRAEQEAAAKLREADRRKDEFLATLAHELRNPLAPIRTGAAPAARGAAAAATAPSRRARSWSARSPT